MPITAKKIKKKRRLNISNNEQAYQKLLAKHRKLQHQFKKYKVTHDRKVSLLRCQLKHTLKFVGVKLQNLETRLLWYQKQWKNQQKKQFVSSQKPSKCVSKNKCIQTTQSPSKNIKPPSSKSQKYNIVIPSPSICKVEKSKTIQIPKVALNCNAQQEICTVSNNNSMPLDVSHVLTETMLNLPESSNEDNQSVVDVSSNAIAHHNQLISRLRARLDTMSDILVSTRDKLHSQFDQMSIPESVSFDAEESYQHTDHLNIAQMYNGSISFDNDIDETANHPIAFESSDMMKEANHITTPKNNASRLSTEKESSSDCDFQSVVSKVTATMTALGRSLRKTASSSVSSLCSDGEQEDDPN